MSSIVLIVEDEVFLRLAAAQIAEDAGFEVIEAANADEAIEILRSRSDIRVVFTDIQMPGSMDGVKLANVICNRWPPIAIIVTSGRLKPEPGELPGEACFLSKPYEAALLTEALLRYAA
jgi:CheY-like chemotaxis protein